MLLEEGSEVYGVAEAAFPRKAASDDKDARAESVAGGILPFVLSF